MKNVQPGTRDTYKPAFKNLLKKNVMQCTMQQTKLPLDNRRFMTEIAIHIATEKQKSRFTEGTHRCFICCANLTYNYTLRPQGLILLVD